MMLMQLVYAPVCVIFFGKILEFVTFDVIPTEEIYAEIFAWENVPYSEQADAVGYSSRYIIECSGSIPIFIFVITFTQLLYALLAKIVPQNSCMYKYI